MPTWIWSLLVIVLFVPVLIRVLVLLTLIGVRFQKGGIRAASEAEIPEDHRELLRGSDAVLAAQGFRFVGYALQKDWVAGEPDIQYLAFHLHRDGLVWAQVRASSGPTPQAPFLISYLSCFTNGKLLATRNMDPDIETMGLPYLENQFPFLDSWDAAWKMHAERHRALEAEAPAERIPLEALIFLRNKGDADSLEEMRSRGLLVPAEGALQKPTLRGAWDMARGALRWRDQTTQINQAWLKRPETFPLPHGVEAYSYLRMQRYSPKAGAFGKTLLVLASFFVYAFIWGRDQTWVEAVFFIAILFLHEMGHALAMRAVGYRDVNIFFIPFFGAMASGKPTGSIAAWKEAVVLLAGPVPGMLLGAWLISSSVTWLPMASYQAGWVALTLNALNLLPFSPFDGGKLMELILFRNFPRIGQIFLAGSGLVLAAGAIYLREPILGAVGVAVMVASVKSFPQAKLLAEWRRETATGGSRAADPGPADDYSIVVEIFRRFRALKAQPFAQKTVQAKAILAGLHLGAPGPAAAAFLFVIYLACWALPAVMLGLHTLLPMNRPQLVARADLEPAGLEVYDGFCGDSGVVDVFAMRTKDTLYLSVKAISTEDTARLREQAERWLVAGREEPVDSLSQYSMPKREMRAGGFVRIALRAPLWNLGGLDSALLKGLVSPYADRDEEDWESDTLPPTDSALAAMAAYGKSVDSLREVESALWRSWSAERRRAWVDEHGARRLASHDTLRCWKPLDPASGGTLASQPAKARPDP